MIIILLNLFIIISSVFIYTTFNLLKKNEKLEDTVVNQQQLIEDLAKSILDSDQRIKELDRLGAFKSDDEIGWFFNEVKTMTERLKRFIS
jgi:cell division protein FtsL